MADEAQDKILPGQLRQSSLPPLRNRSLLSQIQSSVMSERLNQSVETCINELRSKFLNPSEPELASLEPCVSRIYKRLGYEPPKVFVVDCPLQLGVLPILLNTYKFNTQFSAPNSALKSLKDYLHPFADTRLWKRFEELVTSEGFDELGPHLGEKVSDRFFSLHASLGKTLDSVVYGLNKWSFEFRSQSRLQAVFLQVMEAYKRRIDVAINDQKLFNKIKELYQSKHFHLKRVYLPLSSATSIGTFFSAIAFTQTLGTTEMYRLLLNVAAQRVPTGKPLYDAQESKELDDFFQLISSGMTYTFMKNICFVLKYPKVVLDEQDRLHNASGPAIEFGEEEKRYAWQGLIIPEYVIEERAFLDPLLIDNLSNIEYRRIMIELYGWEKYLRSHGSKIIHQDRFGSLISRGKLERDKKGRVISEPEIAVEVTNSTAEPDGSFKRYLLRVPPTVTTAKEAVAWTFGMTSADYNPRLES